MKHSPVLRKWPGNSEQTARGPSDRHGGIDQEHGLPPPEGVGSSIDGLTPPPRPPTVSFAIAVGTLPRRPSRGTHTEVGKLPDGFHRHAPARHGSGGRAQRLVHGAIHPVARSGPELPDKGAAVPGPIQVSGGWLPGGIKWKVRLRSVSGELSTRFWQIR